MAVTSPGDKNDENASPGVTKMVPRESSNGVVTAAADAGAKHNTATANTTSLELRIDLSLSGRKPTEAHRPIGPSFSAAILDSARNAVKAARRNCGDPHGLVPEARVAKAVIHEVHVGAQRERLIAVPRPIKEDGRAGSEHIDAAMTEHSIAGGTAVTTIPDSIALAGLVVPAASGIAGYWLAGRNEQARDERTAKREAIARRATVRERLQEQSRATQRETLLALRDTLQRYVRSVAKIINHDRDMLAKRGQLTQLGVDLSNESYELGVETRRLEERVLDTALREAVGEFRSRLVDAELSLAVKDMSTDQGLAYLDRQMSGLVEHYVTFSEQLGAALRAELGWLPDAES
jgi:hypothetical protein